MDGKQLELRNNIRFYRRLNDLTKRELGEMINRSPRNIGQIETSETMPPLQIAWQLADILNLPINELFFKKGEEPEQRLVKMNR